MAFFCFTDCGGYYDFHFTSLQQGVILPTIETHPVSPCTRFSRCFYINTSTIMLLLVIILGSWPAIVKLLIIFSLWEQELPELFARIICYTYISDPLSGTPNTHNAKEPPTSSYVMDKDLSSLLKRKTKTSHVANSRPVIKSTPHTEQIHTWYVIHPHNSDY